MFVMNGFTINLLIGIRSDTPVQEFRGCREHKSLKSSNIIAVCETSFYQDPQQLTYLLYYHTMMFTHTNNIMLRHNSWREKREGLLRYRYFNIIYAK